MTTSKLLLFLALFGGLALPRGVAQEASPGPRTGPEGAPARSPFVDLTAFGPVQTVAEAEATLGKAIAAMQVSGGGVLVIPVNAPAGWQPQNILQESLRIPVSPAPAKSWKNGAGVTLLDARSGSLALPQLSGLELSRTYNLPGDGSAPHWTYHPMVGIKNEYLGGTSDVQSVLQQPVPAGRNQKFYVGSLRGHFPGQVLEVAESSPPAVTPLALGEFPPTTTKALVRVVRMEFDKALGQPYLVADAPLAFAAGTVLRARTTAGAVKAVTNAHTELQSFDVFTIRHHYSQGDSYLFDGRLHYMGDEYSPAGAAPHRLPNARNSVIYNAVIKTESNIFRAQVASYDAARQELKFTAPPNAGTLGTGRALINLNPKKWVTSGSAFLMNPGGVMLNWGGSLRSTDAPWSADMVGRFFSIDEPGEIIPRSDNVRRWWYISGFKNNPDGSKTLSVRRYWWGTKNEGVGISGLRDARNYSGSATKPKLLKYIIAPGAEVYDVTGAVGPGAARQILKLAPHPHTGGSLDFEAGDPVEQAIGPEPFHPIALRAWTFDEVPGTFPAPIFDVANLGKVQRDSVLTTGGAWFSDVISQEGAVQDAVQIKGQVQGSLIRFEQRNPATQWLRTLNWHSGTSTRSLNLNTRDGSLHYNGPLALNGNGLSGLGQLGVTAGGANLRGVEIPVPTGATSFQVALPAAEKDAAYTVNVQAGWLTDVAVTGKSSTGFQVQFSDPAPASAKIHWFLIH